MTDSKGLTIGLLTSNVGDGIGRLLWSGVLEQCQEAGVNLVTFVGNKLANPTGSLRQANVIYDLVDRNHLDGLVVWASSLSVFVGPEASQHFCDRFRPLPMVSIGQPLAGIPSLVVDSYAGMRAILIHLVKIHGCRRIAIMRGPEQHYEAQRRYQAYLDVVREFDLDDDPGLVTPPATWNQAWGIKAAHLLVEERRKTFDALAGVNDELVVGAIRYLQEHGLDVPGKVAVTGFDNTLEGRVMTPAVTTIRIRMRERGRQAVRVLLAHMSGEMVPGLTTLPPVMIVRQSCGCPDQLVAGAGQTVPLSGRRGSAQPAGETPRLRASQKAAIRNELERSLDLEESPSGWSKELLEAFLAGFENSSAVQFLQTLQRLMSLGESAGGELASWQRAITVLRAQALPLFQADPERMEQARLWLHQARVMIGAAALKAQSFMDWNSSQQTSHLIRIRQNVTAAQNIDHLADVLARELPALGIRTCYLALYKDSNRPLEGARLVLAFDENRRCSEREGQDFTPDMAFNRPPVEGLANNFVLHPLYFRDDPLGYILIDAHHFQGTAHQVLCDQLSSAIKSVQLVEQNIRLYHQALEAQRAAEDADLLKSRFLSMVSHELLTPMVLLVGLSEMMLHEGVDDRSVLPDSYRKDLTRIHASAQQLGNLVRDVLDLSRSQLGQLTLAHKPVQMEEVLRPVALVGEQMARSKGLAWRCEIPEDLPEVLGDAARLQQVTLNLVSNAVKFTVHGEVALLAGLEDGRITIAIQDTGLGVPLAEQEAIFDEFHQSERTVARGYGGLGIGLAICRELIELQGGRIGVESSGQVNGGSTFYFTLPALPDSKIRPPSAASQVVLIIGDQAEHSAGLKAHLVQEGYQVEVVGIDENPGWMEQVLVSPPGAVVLDVPAAGRGMALVELLKSSPVTMEIPVIFYSLLKESRSGAMLELDYLEKQAAATSLGQILDRYGLGSESCDEMQVVLVADDDPEIRELYSRLIARHLPDCRVLQAANGRIALEQMRLLPPSIVLLDMRMPELDGPGVLKAMQEDKNLRGVPVVVLTAQMLVEQEMRGLNQGVAAVLTKGVFTTEETLAHIDKALARSKRLGNETQRLVRKVMANIHEHFSEAISRQEMAAYAGVSERHLNRCFLQETGLSPLAYLNRFRIQQAKVLLKEGKLNITEVMGATGFADSGHFTRVFRREVGVSPREYQKGKH